MQNNSQNFYFYSSILEDAAEWALYIQMKIYPMAPEEMS